MSHFSHMLLKGADLTNPPLFLSRLNFSRRKTALEFRHSNIFILMINKFNSPVIHDIYDEIKSLFVNNVPMDRVRIYVGFGRDN